MRKSDQLIAKLGASLAKTPPTSSAATDASPMANQGPEGPELAAKISISLYAEDLAHVDALIAYMAQRRRRINRSEAIKLALRATKLTPELAALHEAIQRDDGRRKKSSKNASSRPSSR